MGFNNPANSRSGVVSGVDTGATTTGPGVRMYQDTANNRGVLEWRDGVTGDPVHVLTLDASGHVTLDGNRLYTSNAAVPAAYTDPATAPFTPAAGWTVTAIFMQAGPNGTGYLDVTVQRTGATINVPTDGNIGNQQIGTVDAAWCPPLFIPAGTTFTGPIAQGWVNGSGQLWLAAVASGASLATGAQVQLATGFYPLKTPTALT
jgi:hypothetical protein